MIEQTSAANVAKGTSYFWTQTIFSAIVQIVAFAFVARLISTSEMGVLAILSLIVALVQLVAPLALPWAITRFVAEELVQGRRRVAAGILYQSMKVAITLSTIMATICFLFATSLSRALSSQPIVFQLVAVDVLLTGAFVQNLVAALMGAQRFRDYSIVTIVYKFVRNGLVVVMLLLFREFYWLVVAWVISDSAYILVMMALVVRALGPPNFDFDLRRLLSFSIPLIPYDSASFGYNWYDRALLVPYVSLSDLGIYNATVTAFSILTAVTGGFARVLYPAYAQIQSMHGRAGLVNAVRIASRYVSLIAVPLTLGLFVTAKPALTLLLGKSYEHGSSTLQIMTAFFGLTFLGDAFGDILILVGQTALTSAVTVASACASLVSALLLVPSFGINGAAASRGVGMLVGFISIIILMKRWIGASFDLEAFWKSLAAGIVMVLLVWLAEQFWYSLALLPLYVVLGTLVYTIGLRLLKAVHADDLKLMRQFLGGRYEPLLDLLSRLLAVEHQERM